MIHHDPRCDQQHTPRQRCNRRMTPADARLARLAVETTMVEPPDDAEPSVDWPAPDPEPAPERSAVREAVATIEPLEPTVFVSREWNETAEAVEQANRPPSPPSHGPGQSDPSRTAALIGAALGLALLLISMRRRRADN